MAEAGSKLKSDLRALLTDAQKDKLKPLEEALRLQSLANEAVCEGFIEPLPSGSPASTVLGAGRNFCAVTVGFPPVGVN
jgi:hypothetical protein